MTASTKAHLLLNSVPQIQGGAVLSPIKGGGTQRVPMVAYGAGTPAGTIAPWKDVPKGSIWLSNDQSANAVCAWVKIADNSAVADWVPWGVELRRADTMVFNMDAAAAEYDYLYFPRAALIIGAYLAYSEATDASAAAEGNISAGTVADGEQIVAATLYEVSKAIGYVKTLTVVSGTITAGGVAVTKNTPVAATEAGQFRVEYFYLEQ